jgi:hypothetical protein
MAPLLVFFLFTAVQRPNSQYSPCPFRQRCAARQSLAVITPMVIAVRLIVYSHPNAGTAGRPAGGSGQQGRRGVSWEANLGDRSLVHETGGYERVIKLRFGHHHAESPLVR